MLKFCYSRTYTLPHFCLIPNCHRTNLTCHRVAVGRRAQSFTPRYHRGDLDDGGELDGGGELAVGVDKLMLEPRGQGGRWGTSGPAERT